MSETNPSKRNEMRKVRSRVEQQNTRKPANQIQKSTVRSKPKPEGKKS
jgi:hypothetical protein